MTTPNWPDYKTIAMDDWGASKTAVSEFDKSGELLLRVTTPNSDFSYRAIKVDSAALNPADLRAAVGESQKPRGQ